MPTIQIRVVKKLIMWNKCVSHSLLTELHRNFLAGKIAGRHNFLYPYGKLEDIHKYGLRW